MTDCIGVENVHQVPDIFQHSDCPLSLLESSCGILSDFSNLAQSFDFQLDKMRRKTFVSNGARGHGRAISSMRFPSSRRPGSRRSIPGALILSPAF